MCSSPKNIARAVTFSELIYPARRRNPRIRPSGFSLKCGLEKRVWVHQLFAWSSVARNRPNEGSLPAREPAAPHATSAEAMRLCWNGRRDLGKSKSSRRSIAPNFLISTRPNGASTPLRQNSCQSWQTCWRQTRFDRDVTGQILPIERT